MSGPDEGMLTAQERAALASLESRASADDPRLADHLRGLRSRERLRAVPKPDVAWLSASVAGAWRSMRPMVWGPVCTVVGLAIVVLGLAVSLGLSVVGLVVAGVGIGLLVQAGMARLERLHEEQTRQRAGSPSD